MNGFEPSTFTIGNVCARVAQSAASQTVASVDIGTRSKYAARNGLRVKHIRAFAVGEWPRDPVHMRAVCTVGAAELNKTEQLNIARGEPQ
ncbi:MAG: hypothetical protein ACYSU7_17595 [Planctomycetota bacterium]